MIESPLTRLNSGVIEGEAYSLNEADFIRSTGVVTLNVGPELLDVTASNLLRKLFKICQMVINYSNNDINLDFNQLV